MFDFDLFETPSHKVVFQTLRKEFESFPNVGLLPIGLGAVGIYNNRACTFEWRTTLAGLGVNVNPVAAPSPPAHHGKISTLYLRGKSSEFSFDVQAGQPASANFSFGEKNSLTMQALGLGVGRYDIVSLQNAIEAWIATGGIWVKDWVVVTEVTTSASCSIIFSRSDNAKAAISTRVPFVGSAFNIADTTLGLRMSHVKGEVLSNIAQTGIEPFFQIHKLKGWKIVRDRTGILGEEPKRLEPYGKG